MSTVPRKEYLKVLDDPAFGATSEVESKSTSHSDPASQWTVARKGPAFLSYSTIYQIDTDHSVIVDVEGTRSIRQTEVGSVRTMLDRIKDRHNIDPERLIADTAYGSGSMLGWLTDRNINPTFQCWIKLNGRTAPGLAPTLNGTLRRTNTSARKSSRSRNSAATT